MSGPDTRIQGRCLIKQSTGHDGADLVCWRYRGHVEAPDPDMAAHFDPDANKYWGYPGKLEVSVEIPGHSADAVYDLPLPSDWAQMSQAERNNRCDNEAERVRSALNVTVEYVRS
jgi:hypothetical protein